MLANSCAPISSLHCFGGPAAILRAIGAVVVDAVDRVGWRWARAHISEEVIERRAPAVAHGYASPAVVIPVRAISIEAACLQVAPCVPFRANARFARHAVRGSAGADLFCSQATTARARAVAKRGAIYRFPASAITLAQPQTAHVPANDRPSADAPAGHFDEFWHRCKFTMEIL